MSQGHAWWNSGVVDRGLARWYCEKCGRREWFLPGEVPRCGITYYEYVGGQGRVVTCDESVATQVLES